MGKQAAVKPLEGVRVIEVGRVAPVSYCTLLLADMGADVLKVEGPPSAHQVNTAVSPLADQWRRRATNMLHRGKRSLVLDLKHPRGGAIFRELAARSDIVVEGFRPGVMARLGASFEALSMLNPRLVYCSMSGWGQDGPYRDFPAHDLGFLSMAGVLNLVGPPGDIPVIPLNLIADFGAAAMHAVAGIMFALFSAHRTGQGQRVDISYLDTTLALLGASPLFIEYLATGLEPRRGAGVYSGEFVYYSVYPTSDERLISLACAESHLWHGFCDHVGKAHLKDLELKRSDHLQPADERHRKARIELVEMFRQKTADDWFQELSRVNVPVAKVYQLHEVLGDPQVMARGMRLEVRAANGEIAEQVGPPIKLSTVPRPEGSLGPYFGEHTDAVLTDLGYSSNDIDGLRADGVV